MVFGVMAYRELPVSDLPAVDFPTIQVQAVLPGASPETMASSVALPLEKQFSSIPGLTGMNSTSNQGSTSITLQFALDRDIDAAAQDVQAMIGARIAQSATADAGAALVSEGQPGRPAGSLRRVALQAHCRFQSSTSMPSNSSLNVSRPSRALLRSMSPARRSTPCAWTSIRDSSLPAPSGSTRWRPPSRTPTATCPPAPSTRMTGLSWSRPTASCCEAAAYESDHRRLPQRQPGAAARGRARL